MITELYLEERMHVEFDEATKKGMAQMKRDQVDARMNRFYKYSFLILGFLLGYGTCFILVYIEIARF